MVILPLDAMFSKKIERELEYVKTYLNVLLCWPRSESRDVKQLPHKSRRTEKCRARELKATKTENKCIEFHYRHSYTIRFILPQFR